LTEKAIPKGWQWLGIPHLEELPGRLFSGVGVFANEECH
jgi:hypothetical protein